MTRTARFLGAALALLMVMTFVPQAFAQRGPDRERGGGGGYRGDRERNGERNGSNSGTGQNTDPSMDAQYKVLLERSIFARTGVARAIDRPTTGTTQTTAPTLTQEQVLVFIGVLAQDREYVAFFENQQTHQLTLLRTGDDV